jgi:hypothetical protein
MLGEELLRELPPKLPRELLIPEEVLREDEGEE